ncbi:MAG: Na(+)-translocating NADH-quinone reductase subunit C [Salinisphaeraceae bacterium]|nr:Na(+)-translocating NADH-quinone reductase subunit C [Salinisphaeraceae bacterium]
MPGILNMSRDGIGYIVVMAVGVCLVCSVFVSGAAVYLKPLQNVNKAADRQSNILEVAGLMEPGIDVRQRFDERIDTKIVEIETGEYVESIDPEDFEQQEAARDPEMSVKVPREEDIAGIKQRSRYAEVYLVKGNGDEIESIILPVHGYGLWSTMYGFIALEPDANTVQGLKFYQQGETPGLGAEVENPKWRDLWPGKLVYGPEGEPQIRVIKGSVSEGTPNSEYKVDGLSGATITSRGVSNMLEYWMGERGFQPFLKRIRQGSLTAAK